MYKKGDRVSWSYKHWLNSRSSTMITKHGVFIRKINRKQTYLKHGIIERKMGLVLFDGNKHPSRVPLISLFNEPETLEG